MPRPGPRPYECVRRAWHSDRHQPIRGSLIREIFRIVNQVHCPSTRKNREWQETLPIVVLKAEEIIYSKANSEAEYSDLKTLWERVNDAIDTIIRRDEGSETGQLLQPCIEAALHLGCTPRRSSRSQRNECPRYYLRPESMEATSVPSRNAKAYGNHTTTSPLLLHYFQYLTTDALSSFHSCLRTDNSSYPGRISNVSPPATFSASDGKKFPPFLKSSTPNNNQLAPGLTSSSSKAWSIYPLYDPELTSLRSSNLPHDQHPSHSSVKHNASRDFVIPSKHERTSDEGHGIECDLTLRLGSPVAPGSGIEHTAPLQVRNGHSSMLEGRVFMSHLKE